MTDQAEVRLDDIEAAIKDIAAGKAVIVVDDHDRENEGDLIFAAEKATPELVAFMVRYSSGYICAPLTGENCDRLDLPPMTTFNQDIRSTAYTVTVDAATGTTGISAADRAETLRRLANPRQYPWRLHPPRPRCTPPSQRRRRSCTCRAYGSCRRPRTARRSTACWRALRNSQ